MALMTERQKATFLAALARSGNMALACRETFKGKGKTSDARKRPGRNIIRKELRDNPAFADAVARALADAPDTQLKRRVTQKKRMAEARGEPQGGIELAPPTVAPASVAPTVQASQAPERAALSVSERPSTDVTRTVEIVHVQPEHKPPRGRSDLPPPPPPALPTGAFETHRPVGRKPLLGAS